MADAPALTGTIHLVRHGEVDNPGSLLYGRLPGFHLSPTGRLQAEAAAARLAGADVGAVWASPLERAQETATVIASRLGLGVNTDDRLTESATTLEGVRKTLGGLARSPGHWWSLRNPWRPSWGETFVQIRARMVAAVADAIERAGGRDAVVVSHQTPVLVARLALARRKVPPWLAFTSCETGSVTTLELQAGKVVAASYFVPEVSPDSQ